MSETTERPPLRLRLIEWRPLRRNTLLGFATILAGALKIHDVSLHEKEGKRWVGMPAKPVVSDGKVQMDARGKVRYAVMLEWDNKDAADRFGAAVFDAVLAEYPDDLAS